jgi:hypothetical protein
MKHEKVDIRGRNGFTIAGSLIRQDRPASRLAVFFPGLTYRTTMPVLYYPRQLLLARGYDVLSVDYTYDRIPEFMALGEEDKIAWIGADAREAISAAFALGNYGHFTLVGKSLGTAAMAAVAPDEPRLASADLVWLTPGFKTHGVLTGMERSPQRSIVVIGTADPHYEELYVAAACARGSKVVLMPDLDHGLENPGDIAGSLTAMRELIEHLATWLDAPSDGSSGIAPRR